MNKYIYPAKIIINEDNSYTIDVIDLEGCITEGETMEEALENAKEAVGLYLDDLTEEDIPKPTFKCKNMKLNKNEFIALVDFDLDEYRKKYGSHAIKKTLTIPSWLNAKAEARNLNFSQILQNALKKELNINV